MMHLKKILLFVLVPTLSFAQFSRGQVFTNGLLSVGEARNNYPPSSYTAQSSSNSFSIASGWGVFVNSNVAIGSSVGYRHSYQEFDYPTATANTTQNSIFANLFVRRYYKITESFYFATQGKVEYSAANNNDYQDQNGIVTMSTTKTHTGSLSVTPYFVFFPSKRWAVEAGIGTLNYSFYNSPTSTSHGNSFGLSFGTFSFGLGYYFKRKE